MAVAKSTLAFSAKSRIQHAVFGLGTVVTADAWRTTIAFDDVGTKKFVTRMVQLVASDTPAPKKRGIRKKKLAPAV